MPRETRATKDGDLLKLSAGSDHRLSAMADRLVGSEILGIAAEIRALLAEGQKICNLTVGDFSPQEFRIPQFLETAFTEALARGETNYPPAEGIPALRKAIRDFYLRRLGLDYSIDSVIVTSGSRPGIYATYRGLVDPGEIVVYPVPSWNNNHYCHLAGAQARPVFCTEHDAFLPTRALLEKPIRGARLLALNSPLNPTGTAFAEGALREICDLVIEENERRGNGERPLYVMFDQVYWMLTFGKTRHVNPVSLHPKMKDYTLFVDGISKAFAATGVRVGWLVGPEDLMRKMAYLITHLGAWAPRPGQVATAKMLNAEDEIGAFHSVMKSGIEKRLTALDDIVAALRSDGFPVHAIEPMGAIYLSVRFALKGMRTASGKIIESNEDIRQFLLQEAKIAVVPFHAFGSKEEDGWFRLSVGAISLEETKAMLPRLKAALSLLHT